MSASRINLSHSSWDLIWSHGHRVLVVNTAVVLTNLPLLAALAMVNQPWRYPVFFALLSLSVGPSLAGVFAYLHDDDRPGVRDFVRGYRRYFRRAALVWSLSTATTSLVATDIVLLHDSPVGALLVPMLAVVALLVTSAAVLALTALVVQPGGLRATLMAALRVSIRRWWVTLVNLALLLVAVVIVNQAPVLGLATVPGFILFVVWNNNRALLDSTYAGIRADADGRITYTLTPTRSPDIQGSWLMVSKPD